MAVTCSRCSGLLRRDESGPEPWPLVCVLCGRAAGSVPEPPPAVPVVKSFRDTPSAEYGVERQARRRAILWELLQYPYDSQEAIAKRLGVSRTTVGNVAVKYGLSRGVGRPGTATQPTYHEQLRRIVVWKPTGKTYVA